MAISMPLLLSQVSAWTDLSFSPNIVYCLGTLGAAKSEKNLPVNLELNVFKLVQTENYSTVDHHAAQSFCA
jgi:hypothetical protein